jgi:predicted AAA+ superfamily ATPase
MQALLDRLDRVLGLAEAFLCRIPAEPDWNGSAAFRWRNEGGRLGMEPVSDLQLVRLDDIQGLDRQKGIIDRNTRSFVRGLPANNVLLTGARGTGKSSLVKAMLEKYRGEGLRLVEVDRTELADIATITGLLRGRPEKFLLFLDDLSFDDGDPAYKSLKVALDGSMNSTGDNILIYATSNRRHLMPEYFAENAAGDGELHPGEAVDDKLSLSERFGIWLPFYTMSEEEYVAVALHWLDHFQCAGKGRRTLAKAALAWSAERGARNGRVAYQFARDYSGRIGQA